MLTLSTRDLLLVLLASYFALDLILSGLLLLRRGAFPGRVILPAGIALLEVPFLVLQTGGNLSLPAWTHLILPLAGALLLVLLILPDHIARRETGAQQPAPGPETDADGQEGDPVTGQDPPHRPPSTRTGSRREPSGRESPPRSSALRSPRCVRGWPYSPPSPLSGGRPCFNPFRNPPAAGRSASDTFGFTPLS